MKKIFLAVLVVVVAASFCYAADSVKPKANEPIGGVVEAGGVFVGKVVNVLTDNPRLGTSKGSVTVADERGKTMTFVVDPTVKFVDTVVNAATLNQLKMGEKVSVKYSKEGGADKAKSVTGVK